MLGAGTLALAGAAAGAVRLSWRRDGLPRPPALIEADFAHGRFEIGGLKLADEAAFLAAFGGVAVGSGYKFGPHLAPDAPELLINGDSRPGKSGGPPAAALRSPWSTGGAC